MTVKFKNRKLIYLSAFIIIVGVFVIYTIIAFSIVNKQAMQTTEKTYQKDLEQFANLLKVFNTYSKNKLISSERIASNYLTTDSRLKLLYNDTMYIEALVDETSKTSKFTIGKLFYNDTLLVGNKDIIEKIRYISGAFISIWIKTDQGYIRISSNEIGDASYGGMPIFIHNSNPIVQTINKGQKYYEEKNLLYDTKISVYKPIYIDGFISAIIQVSENKGIHSVLNKIYLNSTSLNKNNFFFISNNGNMLLNPGFDENFSSSKAFREIKLNSKKIIHFTTINKGEELEKILYVKKISALNGYAGVLTTAKNDTIFIQSIRIRLVIGLIVLSLLVLAVIFFILRQLFRFESNISKKIKNISDKKINTNTIQVLGVNSIISNDITNVINERNLIQEHLETIIRGSELDSLNIDIKGKFKKTLLKLSDNINEIRVNYTKQKNENSLRQKYNKGTEEISVILQHAIDIKSLSMALLVKIIDFLEVEMGGIFVLEKNNDEVKLIQSASYAYNKKRLLKQEYSIKEGLIGRCYLEKQSIFLTEIPDDYTKIESGFGEVEPKSLVLVPFIFNNEVQGIIELASINIIENDKIEFLEKVGENIASTFSNIYTGIKTQELLSQTREQSGFIEKQRTELEEKIATHRRQNRKLDKKVIELTEVILSIKEAAYVVEYDLTGEILDINDKTLNLLGITHAELITKTHKDLVFNETYDTIYKGFWTDIKKGNTREVTEKITINKNEQFTFLNIYAPIKNPRGRIYRILAIGFLLYEEYLDEEL